MFLCVMDDLIGTFILPLVDAFVNLSLVEWLCERIFFVYNRLGAGSIYRFSRGQKSPTEPWNCFAIPTVYLSLTTWKNTF